MRTRIATKGFTTGSDPALSAPPVLPALLGLLALTASACQVARPGDGAATDRINRGGAQTHDARIDDERAESFYKNLSYRKTGGSRPHQFLRSGWECIENTGYARLCVSVDLLLTGSKDFVLVYEEGLFDYGADTMTTPLFKQAIPGKWKLDREKIVLGNVAVGVGKHSGGDRVLTLEFKRHIHRELVDGLTLGMTLQSSDSSPDELKKGYLELGKFKWMNGKWKGGEGSKDQFSFEGGDRRFVLEAMLQVTDVNDRDFPVMSCRLKISSRDADLSGEVELGPLYYLVKYMPEKYELVSDSDNHPQCKAFVDRESGQIRTRNWYSFFKFTKLADDRITDVNGRSYQKSR